MEEEETTNRWLNISLAGCLIVTSALFSGLTLGLMSLDLSALTILAEAGDAQERELARKIIPLRRNGNLLLCTLLIGNTIVNSFLSILTASFLGGLRGLFISTALIVVFGEIVPQAICSRHGLIIGSRTRFITWAVVCALFVVAWPISKVLDLVLGREVGTMYSRDELKHLIKLQVVNGDNGTGDGIDAEDHNLLAGALEYSDKEVKDVMTPIERVFMLEANTKLTFDTMLEVYKSGYTRIPVYDGSVGKDRVINVLYVKDLILVDPDDEIEVQTVVSFRGPTQVRFISDQTPLNEVFKIFKASFSHLMIAIAFFDPATGMRLTQKQIISRSKAKDASALANRQVTGVITLEDILEEVIKAEIIDEHDTIVANHSMQKVQKGKGRPDMATFLSLFDHKVREQCKLTRQEVHAITAFLTARVQEFAMFEKAQSQLRQLVQNSLVTDIDEDSSDSVVSDESMDLLSQIREDHIATGNKVGSHMVLYRRGEPSSTFTLVLQGRVAVWAGSEEFQSDMAPWSYMGNRTLLTPDYRPDFTAVTSGSCRLMQITRSAYDQAAATVRKAQEARALRFSESFGDRRRSRLMSDKDIASMMSQGSGALGAAGFPRPGRDISSATNTAHSSLADVRLLDRSHRHGAATPAMTPQQSVRVQNGSVDLMEVSIPVPSNSGMEGSVLPYVREAVGNEAQSTIFAGERTGGTATAPSVDRTPVTPEVTSLYEHPVIKPIKNGENTSGSSGRGEAQGSAVVLNSEFPAAGTFAAVAQSKPPTASTQGIAESTAGYSQSFSGTLRGIVMLGESGEPVCLDADDDTAESLLFHDTLNRRGIRRGSSELPGLKPDDSDGANAAVFRVITPGEALRRSQPDWRNSLDWDTPCVTMSGEEC